MTEPIKLPPDLLAHVLVREGVNKHRARDIEQWMNEQITVAAEQAVAAEREACAKLLEDASRTGKIISCTSAANAIRARGQA
jgi:ribosomal protein L17